VATQVIAQVGWLQVLAQVAWQVSMQVTSQVTDPQLVKQVTWEHVCAQVDSQVSRQVMPQVSDPAQVTAQVRSQVGLEIWRPSGGALLATRRLVKPSLVAASDAWKRGESDVSPADRTDGLK
jgi:hypothetical protein